MFTGTSKQQDTRFTNKQKTLLQQMRFGDRLNKRVDMSKVKLDVLRPWISKKITDILHKEEEDDVVVEFVYNQLEEEKFPCPKKMQINMTGLTGNFKNARQFMDELWELLLSAQESESGIPAEFIEQKKEEIVKLKEEKKLQEAKEGFHKDKKKELDKIIQKEREKLNQVLLYREELSRELESLEKRTPSSEKFSTKIDLAKEMLEKSMTDKEIRSRDRRRSRSSRKRNTISRHSRSRDNRRDRRTPSHSMSRRCEGSASRSRKGGSGNDRGQRDRRSISRSRNNSRNQSPANRRDNWDNRYPRRRSPIRRDFREQRDARRILLSRSEIISR